MARKGNDYFSLLSAQASYATKAAEMLEEIVLNFNPNTIEAMVDKIHEIEHEADTKLHELEKKLAREFITTIEREDIAELGKEIDDVIDHVEDVVLGLYMFNVKELRDETREFASLIVSCCKELDITLQKFHNFRKSDELHKHIVKLNDLEEQGDKMHTRSIKRLYSDGSELRDVLIWTELFNRMETCCDKCEEVVNVVQNVIMKNI